MDFKKQVIDIYKNCITFIYTHVSKLKRWAEVEKEISEEEKKVEKKFFTSIFFAGLFLFSSASASTYLQYEGIQYCSEKDNSDSCTYIIGGMNFWPEPEVVFEDTYSEYTFAEDGYFSKASVPTISGSDRSDIANVTRYEIQAGDTLDLIASKFNISIKTITDNNSIKDEKSLETGDILKILPVDGYLYTVQRGDTISGIAKKFDIDPDILTKQNNLDVRGLKSGFSVILPGKEKPVYVAPPVLTPTYTATNNKPSTQTNTSSYNGNKSNTTATHNYTNPRSGKRFSWPVVGGGSVTQGYHYGHYATDIWGANQPGIKAIGNGTVIRAAYNCGPRSYGCQGGYGNLIVIDHGGGFTALYAHNSDVYVKVGDKVTAGQVIAKMGNSGNTRGKTGIHLHIELMLNGRKVNPLSYF